eukprot:scaffold1.g5423.t1
MLASISSARCVRQGAPRPQGAARRPADRPLSCRRAAFPPAAATASSTASSSDSPPEAADRITALIREKEEELQSLFHPGMLAPRAAVVAGLRKEIANLRRALHAAVLPAGSSTFEEEAALAGAAAADAAAQLGAGAGSNGPYQASTRVRDAMALVEAALSAGGTPVPLSSLSAAEQRELLLLQQENEALRVQAAALSAREAQLKRLVQKQLGGGSKAAPRAKAPAAAGGGRRRGGGTRKAGRAAGPAAELPGAVLTASARG